MNFALIFIDGWLRACDLIVKRGLGFFFFLRLDIISVADMSTCVPIFGALLFTYEFMIEEYSVTDNLPSNVKHLSETTKSTIMQCYKISVAFYLHWHSVVEQWTFARTLTHTLHKGKKTHFHNLLLVAIDKDTVRTKTVWRLRFVTEIFTGSMCMGYDLINLLFPLRIWLNAIWK